MSLRRTDKGLNHGDLRQPLSDHLTQDRVTLCRSVSLAMDDSYASCLMLAAGLDEVGQSQSCFIDTQPMEINLGSYRPVTTLETPKGIGTHSGSAIGYAGAFFLNGTESIRKRVLVLLDRTHGSFAAKQALLFVDDGHTAGMHHARLSLDGASTCHGSEKPFAVLFELGRVHHAGCRVVSLGGLLFLDPTCLCAQGFQVSEPARFKPRHSPANAVRQARPCSPYPHW